VISNLLLLIINGKKKLFEKLDKINQQF